MSIFPKIKTLLVVAAVLFVGSAHAQFAEDAPTAFSRAKQENKKVLLVFSGSDWCAACIRFEKNVLEDGAFQTFAADNLVVLKADFPQRAKQPEALVEQNEWLAAQYNPEGNFPAVLLLGSDETVIGRFRYSNENAESFIAFLKKINPLSER